VNTQVAVSYKFTNVKQENIVIFKGIKENAVIRPFIFRTNLQAGIAQVAKTVGLALVEVYV
jgi:hypothetical protein